MQADSSETCSRKDVQRVNLVVVVLTDMPTPVPPTDTATPIPPTDTPEPTESPAVLTDTPEPTATPTEAASPVPEATNTPKPTPKPRLVKIVFTSNRASWDDIFVMNEDGSDVKRLTKMGRCYGAHFTPDGKTIFFSRIAENDLDFWKMNADGSGQVKVTSTTDNLEDTPVVSPDGTRIAHLFAWPGGFEIYTMKADGSDRKPVTSRELDLEPTWSPDSKKIAFTSVRSGSWNIWVVNRDGSVFGKAGWRLDLIFSGFAVTMSPDGGPHRKQLIGAQGEDGGT